MDTRWVSEQFDSVDVKDKRLQRRATQIAQACRESPDKSLPQRFQDWAGLKASYRFFSNPKVTHQSLQQTHYQNVLEHARRCNGRVLFIQDGSELLFNTRPWIHGLTVLQKSVK
jgi:hypothetical protein